MNLNSIKNKKSLKIITLLIAAVFIATVSADVYRSLSMNSTITVTTNDVYFASGTDSSLAGLTIGTPPSTATFTALKAYPNTTTTYGEAVKVTNDGAPTEIRLRPVSFSGDAANFGFINFTLRESSTVKASLNYTSDGTDWTLPATSDWAAIGTTSWSITIETNATALATPSAEVNIIIAVDVK
jgi:hypothetical protein